MSDLDIKNDYDFVVTDIGHITERKPHPQWHIDNLTNHRYYILAYALSGEASYKFDNEEYTVKKGDLLFFPKGFAHSACSNPNNPWSFYSISFDIKAVSNTSHSLDSIKKYISGPNLYPLPSLLSELNHSWTGKRTGYLVRCRSIIMEILYHVIKEMDSTSYNTAHFAVIESILNMIHSNYINNYSVDDLAKISGLSSSHFRLLFKRVTGQTVVQYQNHIKINKAKDLLLSGDCNVTEAALSVGFNDIYYFSRMFKKITGMNPSDYIKS